MLARRPAKFDPLTEEISLPLEKNSSTVSLGQGVWCDDDDIAIGVS